MTNIARCFLMAFILTQMSSCIVDSEECPTGYTVLVSIKDENYVNGSAIVPLNQTIENPLFDSLVETIYYVLHNKETGALVMESPITSTQGTSTSYTILFNDIPSGDYELTVWGNRTSDVPASVLHTNGKEHTDIYLGTQNLTFSARSKTTEVFLERTKGKLVLTCNNFPTTITSGEATISSVYETVTPHFDYNGNTEVVKTAPIQSTLEVFLAPSVKGENSKLKLRFFSEAEINGSKIVVFPEIPVTLTRNEITPVTIDYNTISKSWEIWTTINGKWTMIHSLDIKNKLS